jgi:hypothetical protein
MTPSKTEPFGSSLNLDSKPSINLGLNLLATCVLKKLELIPEKQKKI